MKKILMNPRGLWIVAAVLAIGMIGCKKDTPAVPELTTWYNNAVNNSIKIDNVPVAGGTYDIGVSGNRNWVISIPATAASWVTVSPASGSANETPVPVKITVAANAEAAKSVTLIVGATDNSINRHVIINQLGSDSPGADAIYYEDLGDFKTGAQIREASGITSGWPLIDQFGSTAPTQAWRRGGNIDQSGVTYGGTGSVRNSGANWDSDPAVSGSSTAPYVYQGGGTHAQTFLIEGISLGGKTNLTFDWIMQDTQTSTEAEGGGFVPTTDPITPQTIVLEAGFNGQTYAVVNYTVGTVIGNGWTNVSAEFKVPAGTESLYIRFSGYAGGQGLRMDNFSLTEGGSGPEINPEIPVEPTETTIAELNARITSTGAPVGNYFIKAIVVTDISKGNFTKGSLSIMTAGATTAGNGILLYGQYGSNIEFTDGSGNPLYNAGDELKINLSTMSMQAYRGGGASGDDPYVNELIIPTGTVLNDIIEKTSTGVALTPVTITYDQMADYQNMLVQIETVQSLEDNITTWAGGATNFTFRDDPTTAFPVFLAGSSEIVSTAFSTGNGTIQGIAYVYGGSASAHSVAQLVPRSTTEVAGLTGTRIVGESKVLEVSSEAIPVVAAGGNATVNVTGNVAWTATVTDGAANITSGPTPANGTGDGTITLVFPANTDTANAKTVTLRVSTIETTTTSSSYDIVFTQAAAATPGEHTATFDFAIIGNWTTNTPLTGAAATFTSGDVTMTFARGTHTTSDPAGNGSLVRMYALKENGGGNTLTVATSSGTITNIEFTYGATAAASFAASTGTFASPYATWTGSSNSIVFSVFTTATSAQQRHIGKVVVTYQQ